MSETIYEIAFWFAVLGNAILTGIYGAEHGWSCPRTLFFSFTGLAVLVLLRGAVLS